ncbi:cytochrome-c peroxidase [Capnocytophaga felis]|uniref:Cytochrome-c peroxidase n=2 Tax=Capnocytophaga felis TaxID=2267611 RepID=A0A5M4BBY8_9FLAO|nr:cytochrome-c peroxidase [Capnocytophaga felis]GET49604.1 cytochrome-c peroxidase [Capnocytophaga felis]
MKNNPFTEKGVALGKKIFYDKRISSDRSVSCSSCHQPEAAFADKNKAISLGVQAREGSRNSPPIQNMAFQGQFMWDGASDHLELMPMIPITADVEMNAEFANIIAMMKSDLDYVKLFSEAFDNQQINTENVLKSLAQFMGLMISANSRFDKFRRGENGGKLTSDELSGYVLFQKKCASCHATDLFTDHSFRNNGMPINPKYNDFGRYRVTEREGDKFKFKVPSLRNVEYTAPYGHDGRFATLEDVVEHYRSGVVKTPNLDPLLQQSNYLGISFTETEKKQLIAFLKTLSDKAFINDKRFWESEQH